MVLHDRVSFVPPTHLPAYEVPVTVATWEVVPSGFAWFRFMATVVPLATPVKLVAPKQ
jgi:hypothetical protein